MRCVMCGRALTATASTLAGKPIGPVCAKRAGLTKPAKKRVRIGKLRVVRDDDDSQLTIDFDVRDTAPAIADVVN